MAVHLQVRFLTLGLKIENLNDCKDIQFQYIVVYYWVTVIRLWQIFKKLYTFVVF